MSYCVNCGVELDASAVKCALCNTPVNNPNVENTTDLPKPFSDSPVKIEGVKAKFVASVISVIVFLPNLICFLVNALFTQNVFWSVYVNVTSTLLWIMFVLPFLLKKRRPVLLWLFDTVTSIVYTYFFYALQSDNTRWFFKLALPILLVISVCVLIFMLWLRAKNRHWSAILIHLFADFTFLSVCVGFLVSSFTHSEFALGICLIIAFSALSLMAFFIYCNKSKRVRLWLSKRFFV